MSSRSKPPPASPPERSGAGVLCALGCFGIWGLFPIYFKILQERYANTKYYQEVVRECSYFRFYVKR